MSVPPVGVRVSVAVGSAVAVDPAGAVEVGAPLASVRVMFHSLPEGSYLNAGEFGTDACMFEVDLIEGRTDAQKDALIAALSRVGNRATGLSENEVRVRLVDFPKSNMGLSGGISARAAGR